MQWMQLISLLYMYKTYFICYKKTRLISWQWRYISSSGDRLLFYVDIYLFSWVGFIFWCFFARYVYDVLVCVSLPPLPAFQILRYRAHVSSTVYNIYLYVYNVPSDPTLCRFHSRFRFLLFVSWDALSPLVSCCYVHTVGIHAPQYALRTSCLSPPFLWLSVCHSNTLWHSYTSWLMSI